MPACRLYTATVQYLQQINYSPRLPAGTRATSLSAGRRRFFRMTVAHSMLGILYFALVLGLEKDQLRLSVIVLGVEQCTALINGLLTAEMLLYM